MVAISEVIIAYFDNLIGPKEIITTPENIPQNLLDFTLNCMVHYFYLDNPPKERAIFVSLANWQRKALLYIYRQPFDAARRGFREFMLIMLFNEKDDAILYQYEADISPISFEFLHNLIRKILGKQNDLNKLEVDVMLAVKAKIDHFIEQLNKRLIELSQIELNVTEQIQFPEKTKTDDSKKEISFKAVVIGDPSVGKTSTIIRFTNRAFRRSYLPTVGANITEKIVEKPPYSVSMMIWDLAGHNKFSTIRNHYYLGAAGVLLLFDLTNPESFASIPQWYVDVTKALGNQQKVILLVGNKVDLVDERKVTPAEIKALQDRLKLEYIETSAKSGTNIDKAFEILIDKIIEQNYPE
jgi:Ras-related protein Rab-1A